MKMVVVAVFFTFAVASCGGPKGMSPDEAKKQLQQLMVLYKENKPKFVIQKQQMQQAEDCSRSTALRVAIDKMAEEAAMSPEKTEGITAMQMELTQAEKACLEK